MDAYREEFFGPIGVVYRVADEDAAVTLANDTSFGLGSFVFSNDPEQAARVADRIEAGMVFVNLVGADSPELPFGGIKSSGTARELGRWWPTSSSTRSSSVPPASPSLNDIQTAATDPASRRHRRIVVTRGAHGYDSS